MMKRFLGLALACALALGTVCTAQAIETKVSGQWLFTFGWTDNVNKMQGSFVKDKDRKSGKNSDTFKSGQRVRTQVDFIASENLSAVLFFEIGTIDWGRTKDGNTGPGAGGALDADGVNVETKRAYLDWIIPNTDVKLRMGIQAFHMPWAYGGYGANPALSNEGAGIVLSTPLTEGVGLTAFWLRAFDAAEYDADGKNKMDEMDVFGLTLPITAIDGVRMVPWAMYANIGADSGFWNYLGRSPGQFTGYNAAGAAQYDKDGWASTDTHAWYAGLALNVDIFDPLTFAFDAMYGNLQGGNDSLRDSTPGTKGWFVDAALRYKLDWGTAGLFGWYASGDDDDAIKNNEYGRLPSLGYDWGPGFTSFGFDGSTADLYSDWHVSISAVGTWGLGLEIVNMSFFEDLSHTIRVTYYAGTNDADLVKNNPGSFGRRQNNNMFIGEFQYMTDEDYAVEVNFDHIYTIYEGFTAHLDLGYINMNLDEGTWKHTSLGHETDDAWKATLTFQFRF